jgi:hypothetical protein
LTDSQIAACRFGRAKRQAVKNLFRGAFRVAHGHLQMAAEVVLGFLQFFSPFKIKNWDIEDFVGKRLAAIRRTALNDYAGSAANGKPGGMLPWVPLAPGRFGPASFPLMFFNEARFHRGVFR